MCTVVTRSGPNEPWIFSRYGGSAASHLWNDWAGPGHSLQLMGTLIGASTYTYRDGCVHEPQAPPPETVSYTHLTLPTKA